MYGMLREWKELVDQWMNSVIEVAGNSFLLMFLSHCEQFFFLQKVHSTWLMPGDEGTPESANYSVVDEAEAFPSPPHDLDFLAPEPTGFELSQVLCKHIFPLSYFVLGMYQVLS